MLEDREGAVALKAGVVPQYAICQLKVQHLAADYGFPYREPDLGRAAGDEGALELIVCVGSVCEAAWTG